MNIAYSSQSRPNVPGAAPSMAYTIQVKRRRHESPLDTLVLQNAKRKRRGGDDATDDVESIEASNQVFFRFAHTSVTQAPENRVVLHGYTDGTEGDRRFRTASTKRLRKDAPTLVKPEEAFDADMVPPELREMLADYITPQLQNKHLMADIDTETEDYVYDVYFSEPAGPMSTKNVGYIDLNEDEEKLLFGGSDSDEEDPLLGGDEDSNAEDYYKNDYPDAEESDDDIYGDSDSDLQNELGDLNLGELEWSEEENGNDSRYERYGWR